MSNGMPTHPSESTESSSPIITRAVAAGLQNQLCQNYSFPAWQKTLLLGLGVLPQAVGRFVISRFQSLSGLPPESMLGFSINDLIQARIDDYAQVPGRFPTLTVGVGLGGPSTHLSLALGGPFLPQAFVLTLHGGSSDGDVQRYFQRSAGIARRIADQNPGLMTIQHYDPIHDGWLTRWVNHLRLKLLDLPEPYIEFIRQRLEPGGAIVYLEGGASWLRYRIGERSVFQVGGWGDISPEEFLEGSQRIRTYARHAGLKHTDWHLDGYPLEHGPESEWGTEPDLGEALEQFCQHAGYRFIRIRLGLPHDFSRLAFAAMRKLLEKEGREPAGALVETFSQFDASSARQAGLLPLWLIFNTRDSARFLKEMSPQFPPDKPLFFSPLSTFSLTPDMANWDEWVEALGREDFVNFGARPSHYPADARALVKWNRPLREWVKFNRKPIQTRLRAEELVEIADNLKTQS
jgi:hypothetical protein